MFMSEIDCPYYISNPLTEQQYELYQHIYELLYTIFPDQIYCSHNAPFLCDRVVRVGSAWMVECFEKYKQQTN